MLQSSGGERIGVEAKALGGTLRHRMGRHCGCKERVLLALTQCQLQFQSICKISSRLLKLVTGVDISTRSVNRSGRPGKDVKRRRRTAAAAPNSVAFLLSMLMVKS